MTLRLTVNDMVKWFLDNYESPAECLPYETAEGGYQYIYGGPVDAREELDEQFAGTVPARMIEAAVRILETEHDVDEWSPRPPADEEEEEEPEDHIRHEADEEEEDPEDHIRHEGE